MKEIRYCEDCAYFLKGYVHEYGAEDDRCAHPDVVSDIAGLVRRTSAVECSMARLRSCGGKAIYWSKKP